MTYTKAVKDDDNLSKMIAVVFESSADEIMLGTAIITLGDVVKDASRKNIKLLAFICLCVSIHESCRFLFSIVD